MSFPYAQQQAALAAFGDANDPASMQIVPANSQSMVNTPNPSFKETIINIAKQLTAIFNPLELLRFLRMLNAEPYSPLMTEYGPNVQIARVRVFGATGERPAAELLVNHSETPRLCVTTIREKCSPIPCTCGQPRITGCEQVFPDGKVLSLDVFCMFCMGTAIREATSDDKGNREYGFLGIRKDIDFENVKLPRGMHS
ncbi:hypothetical protein KDA11_06175, partial [Candidatus Saccharibacteria bacterium]|nr:hypothetical protein [Candidatus Saccharibacteria bacterium]